MYGGMLSPARNGIPLEVAATVFMKPKNSAAKKMRNGFHCPKISTASARNPYPATSALNTLLVGTTKINSIDKQKGSLALMKQLVAYKACGIIATHDLVLGTLEEEFPEQIKNYRFEADIKDEELSFSYQLREGIAQNMNACFLMNKMGILFN